MTQPLTLLSEEEEIFRQTVREFAETQIRREDEIALNPMSKPEAAVEQTPAEVLYQVETHTHLIIYLIN